ncbi:MAG: RNA polymerase sigma-70 factor (ECF subfamily) [Planctomycetota bacterium]|jgi:RNA polymerase sigma-70 factor (ECF subfamily)
MTNNEPLDPIANRMTVMLNRLGQGDASAAEELMPLVYDELKRLASGHMANQTASHTFQPTVLAHEAWMRIVQSCGGTFECRKQFFGLASRVMRTVLVDHARAALSDMRGGGRQRVTLDEDVRGNQTAGIDLLELDEALVRLTELDPELARLVELRFFGGLSLPEVAEALELSLRSTERSWAFARSWLHRELMQ